MKRIFAIGLAILILGGGTYAAYRWWGSREGSPKYTTVQVAKDDIRQTVLATGIVQPQNRLEIKPPIAGRAETILVKEGEEVRKGHILAWLSSTERAALLDAARAKGKEELAHWKEIYKPTPLVAPISGLIIARKVEPGQTVTANEAVLVMSDRLIVKAQVDETDVGQVKVGQKARITLDAYPNEKIFAEVDHIAFEAKTVNNVTTYEVEVVPKHIPEVMKSGMTANVNFVVNSKESVLVLPADAIRQEGKESYVLLPDTAATGAPGKQTVETGISDGRRIEIVSGLKEGDSVLIAAREFKLKEGRGKDNPLNPFGAGKRRQGGAGGGKGSH